MKVLLTYFDLIDIWLVLVAASETERKENYHSLAVVESSGGADITCFSIPLQCVCW